MVSPISAELSLVDAARIVSRLGERHRYPHPVSAVELVETHISWVLLAGGFAYKIKKPLDLGFLDFSTREKRRVACVEELRLNARLAPSIYIDVIRITGTVEDPHIDGTGPAIDHAVRMLRFDRTQELDRLLAVGRLGTERIDELARTVADFHATIPPASADGSFGTPATVLAFTLGNFEQVEALEHAPDVAARIGALAAWTRAEHARISRELAARLANGYVRECHGDLHLANIVLYEGRVTVFDCIEFNPALRWVDVMAEIAFTTMDLAHRRRGDLARRFLNRYLEFTGDYAGLAVLRFYLVYRAMVRAKVAAIRAAQETDASAREKDEQDFRGHLDLAETFARPPSPALVITHGPSGCGKSFAAAQLTGAGDWIRIRSDVERKRLAGLAPEARSQSPVAAGIYAADTTTQTYARLADLARTIINAGFPVIVDATFLDRDRRGAFRALALELRVPFAILAPAASDNRLRQRLRERDAAGTDASEATIAVLDRQLSEMQPLDADELGVTVAVDEALARDPVALVAAVTARMSTGPYAAGAGAPAR